MIKAILACDEKGGVGKDGTLPWPNNSKDLQWFKDNTTDHIIVMGSSTWNDPHMPCPMPNRVNVVATNQDESNFDCDGILKGDLKLATLRLQDLYSNNDVWVIGGSNIIEQTLGVIEEFYISRIPGEYDCDTFLPMSKIETLFERVEVEEHEEVTFEIWRKRETIS